MKDAAEGKKEAQILEGKIHRKVSIYHHFHTKMSSSCR